MCVGGGDVVVCLPELPQLATAYSQYSTGYPQGYIFRITGGNDKQGFPMKQGVLTNTRVRLLLDKNKSCYRAGRKGERKRKSVRGCIVDSQMSVISLVIVKKGAFFTSLHRVASASFPRPLSSLPCLVLLTDSRCAESLWMYGLISTHSHAYTLIRSHVTGDTDIPGITDVSRPRRLGPKRASKIKQLFALEKGDNIVDYAKSFKRKIEPKEGKGEKHRFKYPKVQRLVTPRRLQRKRHMVACKRVRAEKQRDLKTGYATLLAQRAKEHNDEKIARKERLSSTRKSGNED